MLCHGFEGGGGSRKSRKTVSWSSGLEGGVGLAVAELAVGGFRGRTGPSRAHSRLLFQSFPAFLAETVEEEEGLPCSEKIQFHTLFITIRLAVEWLLYKMNRNCCAVKQDVVKNAHDSILT